MLRVIGDVHQKYQAYRKICNKSEETLQIGDMGFHYNIRVDKDKHKFFGGNHDNYRIYDMSEHQIGHYGVYTHGGVKFFFIRGAFSIDKEYRAKDVTWWEEEQLEYNDMMEAYDLYCIEKPEIMITHSCPQVIAMQIGKPSVLQHFGFNPYTFSTATQRLLQNCFEEHQPDKWIFGHFHKTWTQVIDGTEFQCLNELEYVDVE